MEDANNKMIGKSPNYKFWVCWLFIALLYILVRINIISIPLDRDEGLFGYIGQLILNHGLPYKDAIDHKPPVLFYIYAFALLFVPPTSAGIHIFLHLYNFLTMIVLYFLSKIYFRSSSAGIWTVLSYAILSAEPAIQGFTASAEMFLLLPITLSLLFAVLATRKNCFIYLILSGITGALACWTKQMAIFIVLFILLYLISSYLSLRNKPLIGITKAMAAWGAGALGISLIIAAYFYHKGIYSEFVYWCFTHSIYYSQKINSAYVLGKYLTRVGNILKGDFILIGIGIIFGLIGVIKRNKHGFFVLGFVVFSLMGTIPGYAYAHYFAVVAPSIAVGAGYGFSNLMDMIRGDNRKAAAGVLCALLVILPPVVVNAGYYFEKSPNKISRRIFGDNPFPESVGLANFIAQRTTPNDTVFIFGAEPQILLYSQRKSATSFIVIYPLMNTFPKYKEFQRKAWEEVISSSPEYILFVNLPVSMLWDGEADPWIYEQTRKLVKSDYYLEAVMIIGGDRGRLVILSEMNGGAEVNNYWQQPAIFVYRKKK